MNDAVIIQHVYKDSDYRKLMDFSNPYHAEYSKMHDFDYRPIYGTEELSGGDWHKLNLLSDALRDGYKHVIWLDADAIIVNNTIDLREACNGIGMVYDSLNIVPHYNVGVVYLENTPKVIDFVDRWKNSSHERLWHGMAWGEQAEANLLSLEIPGVIRTLENKWNAYNGTPCCISDVIVKAWHGVGDVAYKLNEMKLVKHRSPEAI